MRKVYNGSSRRETGVIIRGTIIFMRHRSHSTEERERTWEDSFAKVSEQARRAEIESELQREAEFHRVVQRGVTRLKVMAGLALAAGLGALVYASAY